MKDIKWHNTEISDVFSVLESNEKGLSDALIIDRLGKYGPNKLPEEKVPSVFSVFLSQFLSPLILILVLASIAVLFMGEIADGLIILFVLIFNAFVGTIQEGKAQNTLSALKRFISGTATVVRDNKVIIIPDTEVVVGDILILQEGEKVPADARIFFTNLLKVDEASLTGESVPVTKNFDVMDSDVQVSDRRNMVWKGTNITSGDARAIVVATGVDTEIGKISKAISSINEDVPLRKNIANLSRIIILIVILVGLFVFFIGIIKGEGIREMFSTVVSMSVSVIPEGLPIVMTLVLATGVWRMTKKNVLIKKIQAVEALGQVNIIAVDKTGTLTKNEMVLERVYVDGKMYFVGGQGYEPKGNISLDGKIIDPLNHPDIIMAGRVANSCINAKVVYLEKENKWKVSGDPTEAAMGVFSGKVGFNNDNNEIIKTFEIPFDYYNKFHLCIHKFENKNFLGIVGAPEKILSLCEKVWRKQKSEKLTDEERASIENVFIDLSNSGFRVVAVAAEVNSSDIVDPNNLPPLTFVGFFGLRDPIRDEVKQAVMDANSANIKVIMITGDHKVTASAIAKEAGILTGGTSVITGEELDKYSDDVLSKMFDNVSVFARVTPTHKMKIINIFKKKNQIIAMTGDGVNDAPSLATADLGIAMGNIGTEVAKEASDIVLLDDNFGNIISAVEEGRSIYKTIKKVILYLFSTSIGEVFAIIGSILLNLPLVVLPAQIIWLNFVTDGFLDVSLAMEPKEKGLLQKRVKHSKYIIDKESIKRMFFMGSIIAIGTLIMFITYLNKDSSKALTVSMTTLAVFQWFNAWNCKSDRDSIFRINPFKNKFLVLATIIVVILQISAIYTPFLQNILSTVPLNLSDWLYIICVAFSIVVLEEVRKLIIRRKSNSIVLN